MAYSIHFTMLATGSANGLISLWDFETSKLCGVLSGVQGEVVAVEFAEPYPILLAIQTGVVCAWNIKTNRCILKVNTINQITAFSVFSDISSGPSRQEPLGEFRGVGMENQKKLKYNFQEEYEGLQKDIGAYMND